MKNALIEKLCSLKEAGTPAAIKMASPAKFNKFGRTRAADGTKVPCPYAGGKVQKNTTLVLDLNAKYETRLDGDEAGPEAWTESTDVPFIKRSIKDKGKTYVWGRLLDAKTTYTMADGKEVKKAELADYLPSRKRGGFDDAWVKVNLANIVEVM